MIFDHYFIKNLHLSPFSKNFWNSSTFAKFMGKSWLPQAPCASGHCPCSAQCAWGNQAFAWDL